MIFYTTVGGDGRKPVNTFCVLLIALAFVFGIDYFIKKRKIIP
jgi:hypothetical protein